MCKWLLRVFFGLFVLFIVGFFFGVRRFFFCCVECGRIFVVCVFFDVLGFDGVFGVGYEVFCVGVFLFFDFGVVFCVGDREVYSGWFLGLEEG